MSVEQDQDNQEPQSLLESLSPESLKDAADTYLDTIEEDGKLVGDLEQKRQENRRALDDVFRLWQENIAFFEGIQWMVTTDAAVLNVTGVAPKGRERLVDNKVFDAARRLQARLDQPLYQPSVLAMSDMEEDRQSAQAAHGALRWFYHRKDLSRQKRNANWWLACCGIAYLQPYFDPDTGPLHPVLQLDDQGQPRMVPSLDDMGQPIMEMVPGIDPVTGLPTQVQQPKRVPHYELEPMGDVEMVVRSPFQVIRDTRFTEWAKMRFVFVTEFADRQSVLDRFEDGYKERMQEDLDAHLPKDEKVNVTPWIPDVAYDTADYTGIPKPQIAARDLVEVIHYYEVPQKKHPNGRHIIYCGKVVLHRGDLETPNRTLPLYPLRYVGRPWIADGKSPIDASKPLQRAYNRILSRYFEHLVRLPAGWLLIPITSGIPKRGFSPEVGGMVRYNPAGGKPEWTFPPLSGLQYYEHMLSLFERAIENRMALPPVMTGQLPKGAKAAKTVELLKDEADSIQHPTLQDNADGWSDFYLGVLALMDKHYTTKRMVYMLGADKTPQVVEWKGDTQLPSDWRDRLFVQVESSSSMPSTRVGRIEFLVGLYKIGVFGKPGAPEANTKLVEMMGLDAGTIMPDDDLDEAIAGQESLAIQQGANAPVNPWDDDKVHIRVHMKKVKGLYAAGKIPQAQRFIPHIKQHEERLQAKEQAAQKQADQKPGAPKPQKPQGAEAQKPPAPGQPEGSQGQGGLGGGGAVSMSGLKPQVMSKGVA